MTIRGRVEKLEKGDGDGGCGHAAWCARLAPVLLDPGGLVDHSGEPVARCPRCGRGPLIVEIVAHGRGVAPAGED